MATETMKALLKDEPKEGATLKQVKLPEIGEREVLVQVKAAAICGTDIHIYDWTEYAQQSIDIPMIFGHEFCGEVVEIGDQVSTIAIGDLIAGETHIPCQSCRQCRTGNQHVCENMKILGVHTDGSFAKYTKIPEPCAWKLPKDFPTELGAIMEPVGGGVHVAMTPHIKAATVLVTGAGPIGLASVMTADFLGATEIIVTDFSSSRLTMAKKLGATVAFNPKEEDVLHNIMELTNGTGVDVLLEMSGSSGGLTTGLSSLGKKGEAVLFGLPSEKINIDTVNNIIYKETTMYGVTGRKMYETWYQVISLIEKGLDFSSIITHKFNLKDYEEAFEVAKSREGGKILFEV